MPSIDALATTDDTPQVRDVRYMTYVQIISPSGRLVDTDFYTHSAYAPPNATTEQIQRVVELRDSDHRYVLHAFEPHADYEAAMDDPALWGRGFAFTRNRVAHLLARGAQADGQAHPLRSVLVPIDTIYWVEGDPHAKNGIPTLFAFEDAAKMYARRVDLPYSAVRSTNLFVVN